MVGSFWSTKSTMAIATAALISLFFLMLHQTYLPYRAHSSNELQSVCLTALSSIYFIGILLKTDTVENSDQLGVLMVGILVSIIAAGVLTAAQQLQRARYWVNDVSHAFRIHYEGTIREAHGIQCIASFPGKFEAEWNRIVELGRKDDVVMSCGCVFLPMHTPKFGRHVHDPDSPAHDPKCFCISMYGEQKAWGCAWVSRSTAIQIDTIFYL